MNTPEQEIKSIQTQLIEAASTNNHERVEELLDENPGAFFRSTDGGFALYHAVYEGHCQSAQMLLDLYLQFHESATRLQKETTKWDEIIGYTITDTTKNKKYDTLALTKLVQMGIEQKSEYDAIRMAMLSMYLAIDSEKMFWDESSGPFALSQKRSEELIEQFKPMLQSEEVSILKTSKEFDWNQDL